MTDYQKLMNDYSDNLELVEKMYTIKCKVMENGLKKVNMIYYFCSCDPEGNDPICEECKINCHTGEGHITGEAYEAPQICQCGVRCHKLELNDQDSSNRHVYKTNCHFHEIAYKSNDYRYFLREGKKICVFCHIFCNYSEFENEEDVDLSECDVEVRFDPKQKNSINSNNNKDNFIKKNSSENIYSNKESNEIVEDEEFTHCECNHFLHTDVKNIYRKINMFFDENKNCLVGNFGPLRVINLLSLCPKSFINIFGSFFTAIKYLKENIFDPKYEFEKNLNNSNYYWSLIIFANISSWCKNVYFFNSQFAKIFSGELVSGLLNKPYENDKTTIIIRSCVFTCFQKFYLNNLMHLFPNFKISDFINMNPLQRIIFTNNIRKHEVFMNELMNPKYFGNLREQKNIIDFLILGIEHFYNNEYSYIEIYDILNKVTLILKKLSKFYLFTDTQIKKYNLNIEKLIIRQLEKRTKQSKSDSNIVINSTLRSKEYRSFLNIIKTLFYFIFQINDLAIYNYITNSKISPETSKTLVNNIIDNENDQNIDYDETKWQNSLEEHNINLFHHYNLVSVSIFKSTLLLMEIVTSDMKDDKVEKSLEDSKTLKKILDFGVKIISISTGVKDFYFHNMKKLIEINGAFEFFIDLIRESRDSQEEEFLRLINNEETSISEVFNDFFSFKKTAKEIKDALLNSIDKVFKYMGLEDYLFLGEDESGNNIDIKNNFNNVSREDSGDTVRKIEKNENRKKKLVNDYDNELSVMSKSKVSIYRMLFNKSNYIFTLIKILIIPEEDNSATNLIDDEMMTAIFRLLNFYISGQPNNAIMILNCPILYALKNAPNEYSINCLDLILHCLQVLIKYDYQLNTISKLIFTSYEFFLKAKDTEHYFSALNKFLKILKISMLKLEPRNLEEAISIIRASLKNLFEEEEFFENYKTFLLEIAELYSSSYSNNSTIIDNSILSDLNNPMISQENLLKEEEFIEKAQEIFKNKINNYEICPPGLALKIYYKFLSVVNYVYDDSAMFNESNLLNNILSSTSILKILSNMNLELKLRTQLIRYFRMSYIDISISNEKVDEYRDNFTKEYDCDEDTLIKDEDLKIFMFLENLINTTNPDYLATNEYELLLFELINFQKIIFGHKLKEILNKNQIKQGQLLNNKNKSSIKNRLSMIYYFENGIALPLKIYLNKVFSVAFHMSGEEFLKIYKLCYQFLIVKKCLLENNILDKSEEHFYLTKKNSIVSNSQKRDKNKIPNSTTNLNNKKMMKTLIKFEQMNKDLKSVLNDIEALTDPTFQPLNFVKVYEIFYRQLISLIENPKTDELTQHLNQKPNSFVDEIETEKIQLEEFLKTHRFFDDEDEDDIKKRNEVISNNFFTHHNQLTFSINRNDSILKLCDIIKLYSYTRNNFVFLAFQKAIEDFFSEPQQSYRQVFINILFYLSSQELFPEEFYINTLCHSIISFLLKNQTTKTQEYIQKIHSENSSVVNLDNLVNFCFKNIMSIILTQYNPSSFSVSVDYYNACVLLRIFKNLCEEHNSYFQDYFCQKLSFSLLNNKKILFFDFILSIKDKIILLSGWERVIHSQDDLLLMIYSEKNNLSELKLKYENQVDYFYPLFSCLSDLVIEIVQGTSLPSFNNIYSQEESKFDIEEIRMIDNKENYVIVDGGNKRSTLSIKKGNTPNSKRPSISYTNNLTKNQTKAFEQSMNSGNLKDFKTKNLFYQQLDEKRALSVYLNNLKALLFNDKNNSQIIYNARNQIASFILAFLEENNCNNEIKSLIISTISAQALLTSISASLKKFYYKRMMRSNIDNYVNELSFNNNFFYSNENNVYLDYISEIKNNSESNNLKFNIYLYFFFHNGYFEDPSISESCEFTFANTLYRIFKIYCVEFKNNEEVQLILLNNSNYNDNELKEYNLLTKQINDKIINEYRFNKNDSNTEHTIVDLHLIENYFILKFFEEIVKCIRIKLENGKEQNIIFTVINKNNYVSKNSTEEFLNTVNRENQFTKLSSLINQSEYFLDEIEFTYSIKELSKNFYYITTNINYYYVKLYLYLLVLLLNIFMIIYLDENTDQVLNDKIALKVNIIGWILISQCLLVISIWCVSKLPLIYKIETKKLMAYKKIYETDKLKMSFFEKTYTLFLCILKGDIAMCIWLLLCSFLGILDYNLYGFFSFMLFSIIVLNDTFKNVVGAVQERANSLLFTIVFNMIICYIYAIVGLFFFSEQFILDDVSNYILFIK